MDEEFAARGALNYRNPLYTVFVTAPCQNYKKTKWALFTACQHSLLCRALY